MRQIGKTPLRMQPLTLPHSLNLMTRPKLALVAVAALVLSGCQSVQLPSLPNFRSAPGPGPAMAPAALPSFYVGDKYYYSNGAREQVVSVDGEMVNMLSRSKRKLTNFRNFALPQPYIEGSTKEYFKRTSAPTTLLWPLSLGQSGRFSTQGRTVTKDTGYTNEYEQRWSCEIGGTEHFRVLAGEFDTYRVECKRYSTTGRWWQNRTWYYAPILGTYVLRRDFYKSSGERLRELTAVRPSLQDEPENVRQGIIHAWQTALETVPSGSIHSRPDKNTKTSVHIQTLQPHKAKHGLLCRHYKQYLTRLGESRLR